MSTPMAPRRSSPFASGRPKCSARAVPSSSTKAAAIASMAETCATTRLSRSARPTSSTAGPPTAIAARPVYAPALVAFVGGSNFKVSISVGNVGAIAWFPLGPREVYRPSYAVSREYFTSVNTSNTSVSSTNITNVYSATNVTNVTYVNQQVPGAVIAVPTTAFTESKPVAKEAVRVSKETVASTPVVAIAPIAPAHASVLGAA